MFCRKGVEVHNTLFSQLFSFRTHLAIFSIKAWNNIMRVVPPPPPLFSDPIYVHICGGVGAKYQLPSSNHDAKCFVTNFFYIK